MKQRILTLITCILLCASIIVPTVSATDQTSEMPIKAITTTIEPHKTLQQEGIDKIIEEAIFSFITINEDTAGMNLYKSGLSLCSAIHAYEYVNGELTELYFDIYPIISNQIVVANAWVYEVDTGIPIAQIEAGNRYGFEIGESAAVIFDRDSCYLYNGLNFECTDTFLVTAEHRDWLDSGADCSNVELTTVAPNEIFYISDYATKQKTRDLIYSCSISAVKNPTQYACWAACVMSIGNYLTNTSLNWNSPEFSGVDINNSGDVYAARNLLLGIYNAYYTAHWSLDNTVTTWPDVITNNLANDYPVYIGWMVTDGSTTWSHATVTQSINLSYSNRIVVMDPDEPIVYWRTAYYSTYGYYYYAYSNGNFLTSSQYVSKL